MAITNASRLSDFGAGIGTQGAIIQVDNANQKVGIGTTNPSAMLSVGPGDTILMDGKAGVITATKFVGSGEGLTGVASTDYIITGTAATFNNQVKVLNLNVTGVTTSGSYKGDGSALTGISGFGTALDSTQGTLKNIIFKTPYAFTIAAGTSERIDSDDTSGNISFTRLGRIHIGSGSTMTVGDGTTLVMDVLGIF